MAVKHANQPTEVGQATLELHPFTKKKTPPPNMSAYGDEKRERNCEGLDARLLSLPRLRSYATQPPSMSSWKEKERENWLRNGCENVRPP